jgi:hypothetical protein
MILPAIGGHTGAARPSGRQMCPDFYTSRRAAWPFFSNLLDDATETTTLSCPRPQLGPELERIAKQREVS